MKRQLTKLKRKAKSLDSDAHKESFEQNGHCRIPGCHCFQRKPFSYHRMPRAELDINKWIDMDKAEIAKCVARMKREERIRQRTGYWDGMSTQRRQK